MRFTTRYQAFLLALMLLLGSVVRADGVNVDAVRFSYQPTAMRLVFESDSGLKHNLLQLSGPDRVVLDLAEAKLSQPTRQQLEAVEAATALISDLRVASRGSGVRVVLESRQTLQLKSFVLAPEGSQPQRLVIDLIAEATPNRTLQTVLAGHRRNLVIAIDAGHGGRDPGALGPNKILEKQVTYAIAKKLAAIVDSQPGFASYLVRKGDQFIPLRDRSAAAREQRADFFVSIHADAFTNPQAHGASVYALSSSGATSEAASFLAERENSADLIGGVEPLKLDESERMVADALLGLSMDYTLRTSSEVGERVLKEVGKVARLHKKRVEKAAFIVLKSPDLPSLLVETGFISNPTEARRLTDSGYQKRMAEAIFNGIQSYYVENPPPDSYLSDPSLLRVYVVQRGDTLSEIAARYGVTLSQLRAANKLSGSAIRVGQKLTIPTG